MSIFHNSTGSTINKHLRIWAPIMLVLGAVIIHGFSFHLYHNWGPDYAKYIVQAKAIVHGFDYLDMYNIDYLLPWGFPALLSPMIAVFGFKLPIMKLFVTSFFIFSLPVIYLLFKSKLDFFSNMLLLVMFTLSPWVMSFKNNILADFPYLLFLLFSILLIQICIVDRRILVNRYFDLILLGLSIFLAIFIRTQGLVLIPTLIICQLIAYKVVKENPLKYQFVAELIPYLIIVFFLLMVQIIFPKNQSGYLSLLVDNLAFRKILSNIKYYTLLPTDFFGFWKTSAVFYGMTIPLFIIGLLTRIRENYHYILYSAFPLGLLYVWPYQQGLRLIFSVMVFFMFFVFCGLEVVNQSIKLNVPAFVKMFKPVYVFGIVVIFFFGYRDKAAYDWLGHFTIDGPYTSEAIEMFQFIREQTKEDEIVMFKSPPVMTLYTDRRAIDLVKDIQSLPEYTMDYYVHSVDPSSEDVEEKSFGLGENFSLIFKNELFYVYQVKNLGNID